MINMYSSADRGTTLEDGNKRVKFNMFGKAVAEGHTLTLNELRTKCECQAVSVLTANGETEVAIFGRGGTEILQGDIQSHMVIMQAGGYLRRFSNEGEQNGIKFTQIIYTYDKDANLEGVRQCIKQRV